MDYRIAVETHSDQEAEDVLLKGLRTFNAEQTDAAKLGGPINIFVRDSNNKITGGLKSFYYLQTLHIDYLYFDENIRGMGLGKKLLALAEVEAKKHDCHLIILTTFSFQAPDFYQKQGFEIYCIQDLPTGDKRIHLKKSI